MAHGKCSENSDSPVYFYHLPPSHNLRPALSPFQATLQPPFEQLPWSLRALLWILLLLGTPAECQATLAAPQSPHPTPPPRLLGAPSPEPVTSHLLHAHSQAAEEPTAVPTGTTTDSGFRMCWAPRAPRWPSRASFPLHTLSSHSGPHWLSTLSARPLDRVDRSSDTRVPATGPARPFPTQATPAGPAAPLPSEEASSMAPSHRRAACTLCPQRPRNPLRPPEFRRPP